MRRSLRTVLVPLGIYLAANFAVHGFAIPKVKVKWHGQRLLERADLEVAPARSLLLLHSQPPALNALLAFCLETSKGLGLRVQSVVTTLVTGIGAGAIVLVFALVAALTRSHWLAAAAAGAAALDPGFQFFRLWFLAAILVYFLIAVTLFLAFKALDSGERRWLAAAILATTLLPNTKSVFHPGWALAFAGLLVALFVAIHRKPVFARRSDAVMTSMGFLLLLFAWPAKNAYLFDSFAFSSWSALNVARETPVRSKTLHRYLRKGSVSAEVKTDLERFQRRFGDSQIHILARPTRANGARNRNHYAFVSTRDELLREAMHYRLTHLRWWLESGLVNYGKWTRATFVQPYSEQIRGSWDGWYPRFARAVRATFFADLGSLLRRLAGHPEPDGSQQHPAVLSGRWTPYGLLMFPGLIVFASLMIARDLAGPRLSRRKPHPPGNPASPVQLGRGFGAATGLSILCLFTMCWHLVAVCLTDGAEGNRMRFGVSLCFLVLAVTVFASGWETVKARRARPGG